MGQEQKRTGCLSRRALTAGLSAIATLALTSHGFAQTAAKDGGGLGTPEAPVEIRMIANEAFAKQWQTSMVPEFNKVYPNIRVKIDGVPYAELLAKSLLDVTGAKPTYDIIIADDPWIPQLARTGALLDLKKGAGQWTKPDYDWADFNASPLAAGEWEGVQYGVPLRSNMLLMFVNKALYAKAGLPAPTPSLTWAEYVAQAPKLVQDTNGDGKIDSWAVDTYFTRDSLTPTIWQTILNSNGGALLDKDNKPAFDNAEGVKALQAHIDLLKFAPPGASSHGFNESLQAFRQGQVATLFMWGSVFKGTAVDPATTTLTPDQVGIQVMPAGSRGPGAHRGIWSGAITNKSEHPQAAWALLQWLSSKEGEVWHANALGVFPARKSTLATAPEQAWLVPVYAALQQAYDTSASGQMWRPRLAKSDAVQQILADETSRAVAGQISADDALKSAAKKIERLLK
ncbi:ABC transporter substrate-binding protein [Microvirga antarctica]|uniref:ABC transporter substrate-binding protein n=1 Tax=Microvirga antarctica TaxID=2819233 RepID=UPI001B30586A|nr:sugar ABC transporter substrate-binding protein [Microvirga antarctica]